MTKKPTRRPVSVSDIFMNERDIRLSECKFFRAQSSFFFNGQTKARLGGGMQRYFETSGQEGRKEGRQQKNPFFFFFSTS